MLQITANKPGLRRVKIATKLSAGQKVCRKYKRAIVKKIQQAELRKLKGVIPSVAQKKVSKVAVVEEAIRYIDVLQQALADRLQQLPGFEGVPITQEMLYVVASCLSPQYSERKLLADFNANYGNVTSAFFE